MALLEGQALAPSLGFSHHLVKGDLAIVVSCVFSGVHALEVGHLFA